MNDAEYTFQQDTKEKKTTARSARAARTHCGKGGRARLPSDYLSKKELEKMNGECKSYRLNDPMSWSDFQSMPDDLKVAYIKALQQKFDVPGTYLAQMFGIGCRSVHFEMRRLGMASGEGRSGRKKWKKDEFLAWISGADVCENCEPGDTQAEQAEQAEDQPMEQQSVVRYGIPETGSMVFEGDIHAILATVGRLLEGARVHLSITWDVLEEQHG